MGNTPTVANRILADHGTTIFAVMSSLAATHGAINLGQGFPDEDGPEDVRRVAAEATRDGPNQYPSMMGVDALRQAVASHDNRFYGLDVDWQRETMVTSGASEALASCMLGLLNPGDEAILFEPLYDSYLPLVERAGATARLVRLEPPDWRLREADLAAAMNDRTRLVVLNSPMNPTGKVFTADELEMIADWVRRKGLVAVCDEVYEHIVFDGRRHVPLITLPGMRAHCLRIGSAGKTFSLTGWKVGYITAPEHLLRTVSRAHQFLTFTTPPNLQKAVAFGLGKENEFFAALSSDMQAKRDFLRAGLEAVGVQMLDSFGTYFLIADVGSTGFTGGDEAFCRAMTREASVAAVPVSAFYRDGDVCHLARFCFCKKRPVLAEAIDRLAGWKPAA